MSEDQKTIRLSVRDFAVPSPRRGSIDAYSGYGSALQEGIEIHQFVQSRRGEADAQYESEVPVAHRFERGGYVFAVEGRIDGLFRHRKPKIEEIKSTFNVWELSKNLELHGDEHPYALQLLTYGYLYWKTEGVIPRLSLHLVSTRNNETRDIDYILEPDAYEEWLEHRLEALEAEAKRMEKRAERRRKLAAKLSFPFEKPRPGQIELIETIENGFKEQKRLLIQAPTGLGKTAGVLYPALKEALARGQRVVYATPKNSQHSVAEDAVDRFESAGSAIKSLTMTAKQKICMKAEPICNPSYCEYARDYYEKVDRNKLSEKLAKKRKLSARAFRKIAEEYEVCPFELQIEAAPEADLVICDYNYVFAPRSALGRLTKVTFEQVGQPNLVIDEAHNLPSRTMDYYSPALSTAVLEGLRAEIQSLPERFAREAVRLLDHCLSTIRALAPEAIEKGARIDVPVEEFSDREVELRSLLSKYLEDADEIEAGDPLLRLCFYWGQFTSVLQEISTGDHPEFFTTYQLEKLNPRFPPKDGKPSESVKITCCDASEKIRDRYDEYDHVVGFSATLKPFDFYARLSGLQGDRLRTAEFESPFSQDQRKIVIIPQVSTKYSERERNYPRIAEVIEKVSSLRPGNYAAFFPSFDFMHRVAACMRVPPGFQLELQGRNARAADVEAMLARMRGDALDGAFEGVTRKAEKRERILLFAVQGGVFSEGVDYPGEMLVGAFIVGPPLPNFDLEREGMKQYYQEKFEEGFGYAYSYPAMAKAVQAAGRVIRSEKDRGVIVMLDSRFVDSGYAKSMPSDWFRESPRELVSSGILKEISDFWGHSEPQDS